MSGTHPPNPEGRLKDFWNGPVRDLVSLSNPVLAPEVVERHNLFSLLTLALIEGYWNGNKKGAVGEYPWRASQQDPVTKRYAGGDYLGHNIACIAVDDRGAILDFDFNHNDVLNSSVEHAESRLIRRLFSLTQLYDYWEGSTSTKGIAYSTVLSNVTIYTSLESCSQCSGIMALGSVKEVVFLQRDPGQNSIGNILRQLSPVGGRYLPPLPIPANTLGLPFFDRLAKGYDAFASGVVTQPFFVAKDGTKDHSSSITSYLCTDDAWQIAKDGAGAFTGFNPGYPAYRPLDSTGKPVPSGLSNAECFEHATRFLKYAVTDGHRGTPHKL